MAKGDKNKLQNTVNQQVGQAQATQNEIKNTLQPQNTQFWNNYQGATADANTDYRNIMDQYKNFQATNATPITAERLNYSRTPELDSALRGYQDFATTGGFSQNDIADMRARGISPIRSVYANAMNEMARQKNLAGGYSPNFNAAAAKMRTGTSQQIADQVQNVNAQLAQMIQSGRLSGLGGLSQTSIADSEMANRMAMANAENQLRAGEFNRNTVDPLRLNAIQGQAQLFGTTPGMANMFGNQVLQSGNQMLNLGNQQQGIANLGVGGQQAVAQTPSNFETGLGRVGNIAKIGASIAAPFMGPAGSIVTGRVNDVAPNISTFAGNKNMMNMRF